MRKTRQQNLEGSLDQLAKLYPDVLGSKGFSSHATGKRRQIFMDVRERYYAALREVIALRKCVSPKAKKSLSDDVMKAINAVTQRSVGKSN
jgi:hypothetical protein